MASVTSRINCRLCQKDEIVSVTRKRTIVTAVTITPDDDGDVDNYIGDGEEDFDS